MKKFGFILVFSFVIQCTLGLVVSADTIMVAIGGGSRSGKTTLSKALAEKIQEAGLGTAVSLSHDSYFNPREQHESFHRRYSYKDIEGSYWNFDHPTAMDWSTTVLDLGKIRIGETVRPPIYHFGSGGMRDLNAGEPITRPDFFIFEGIHALNERIFRYFDLRIFVDTEEAVRDQRLFDAGPERKQSKKDTESYLPILQEAYREHIEPTKRYADLVVRGKDGTLEENLVSIIEKLKEIQSNRSKQ